ncbi:MAG: DNA polymerase III subunit beta [Desulfovibrionaceae bacterium]|nr:DNA polymerase III subunit beta [Desulfovibrionaceae bacterium]
MNIKIFKEDVLDGLQKAANIIQNRSGYPYLRSLWLQAGENRVNVMATDMNIEFKGSYPSEVSAPGLVGVQGKDFVEIIRRAYPGAISLKLDAEGKHLSIDQGGQQGSFSCKMPVLDSSWRQDLAEFPDKESGQVLWSGDFFQELIDKVSYCISDGDGENISCMLIKPGEGSFIDVCGLNSHQMGIIRFTHDDLRAVLPASGILIQKKYLLELKKWIGNKDVEISLDEKRVFLRDVDHKELFSLPLSSYQYPDYLSLLERSKSRSTSRLTVNRKEIIDALERLSIFNSDANIFTCYDLNSAGPGVLSVSVKSQDKGSCNQKLKVDFDGDLKVISFPTKSMLEIFSHFHSEKIDLMMDAENPCAVSGGEDPDYTVIIMPMKVNEHVNYQEEKVQ